MDRASFDEDEVEVEKRFKFFSSLQTSQEKKYLKYVEWCNNGRAAAAAAAFA
jgi:hypothetical protein